MSNEVGIDTNKRRYTDTSGVAFPLLDSKEFTLTGSNGVDSVHVNDVTVTAAPSPHDHIGTAGMQIGSLVKADDSGVSVAWKLPIGIETSEVFSFSYSYKALCSCEEETCRMSIGYWNPSHLLRLSDYFVGTIVKEVQPGTESDITVYAFGVDPRVPIASFIAQFYQIKFRMFVISVVNVTATTITIKLVDPQQSPHNVVYSALTTTSGVFNNFTTYQDLNLDSVQGLEPSDLYFTLYVQPNTTYTLCVVQDLPFYRPFYNASQTIAVTTPGIVISIVSDSITNDSVTLQWRNDTSLTSDHKYAFTMGSAGWLPFDVVVDLEGWITGTLTGLIPGTLCSITLQQLDSSGVVITTSQSISFTTLALIKGLTVTRELDTINVTWEAFTDAQMPPVYKYVLGSAEHGSRVTTGTVVIAPAELLPAPYNIYVTACVPWLQTSPFFDWLLIIKLFIPSDVNRSHPIFEGGFNFFDSSSFFDIKNPTVNILDRSFGRHSYFFDKQSSASPNEVMVHIVGQINLQNNLPFLVSNAQIAPLQTRLDFLDNGVAIIVMTQWDFKRRDITTSSNTYQYSISYSGLRSVAAASITVEAPSLGVEPTSINAQVQDGFRQRLLRIRHKH